MSGDRGARLAAAREHAANLAAAPREVEALFDALDGRWIPPGSMDDPLRRPNAVPPGRSVYNFDSALVPTIEAEALGIKQAEALIAAHRAKHAGAYPTSHGVRDLLGGDREEPRRHRSADPASARHARRARRARRGDGRRAHPARAARTPARRRHADDERDVSRSLSRCDGADREGGAARRDEPGGRQSGAHGHDGHRNRAARSRARRRIRPRSSRVRACSRRRRARIRRASSSWRSPAISAATSGRWPSSIRAG